jgi:hypothetical protein
MAANVPHELLVAFSAARHIVKGDGTAVRTKSFCYPAKLITTLARYIRVAEFIFNRCAHSISI